MIVNPGSLSSTTTQLSGVPASAAFGTTFTATATFAGSSPTGTVQFVVAGGGATGSYTYATANVASGAASATITLPFNANAYTITAIYNGDTANPGSSSATSSVSVTAAQTVTSLSLSTNATPLGHPVIFNVTVSPVTASAGTPVGTVSLSYTASGSTAPVSLGSATLTGGIASIGADLPIGADQVTATYAASGSFGASTSSPMTGTVGQSTITALSSSPLPLAYTITNLAGGGAAVPTSGNMVCTGATDKYGDGYLGTAPPSPRAMTSAASRPIRTVTSTGPTSAHRAFVASRPTVPMSPAVVSTVTITAANPLNTTPRPLP